METGPLKTVIKDVNQRLRLQARSENADTENEKERGHANVRLGLP